MQGAAPKAMLLYGRGAATPRIVPRRSQRGPPAYSDRLLAGCGSISGYLPNRGIFSLYQGAFDEVLATAELAGGSFPVIARAGNVVLFGLVISLFDDAERPLAQAAFLTLFELLGVPVSH